MNQIALTPVIKRTYEDLLALPDDGQQWELIDGEFDMVPPPGFLHQRVSAKLHYALMDQLDRPGQAIVMAAPFAVALSQFDAVEPDLVIIRRENLSRLTPSGLSGPPDLVVEILSPSNRGRDRLTKRALYAEHGVAEFWLVDPEAKSIEVLVLTGSEYGQHAVFKGDDAVALSHQFDAVSVPLGPLFAPI